MVYTDMPVLQALIQILVSRVERLTLFGEDVVDDGLRETVNVVPLAVTNTVLLVRDIDEVVVGTEGVSPRSCTVRIALTVLLIRDDDHTLHVLILGMLTDEVHH